MQEQVPGVRNQDTANNTALNTDNEDNGMVLGGEEWEYLLFVRMKRIYKRTKPPRLIQRIYERRRKP